MSCNKPNVNLVNINVYTKFGHILSMPSQDIEKKTKFWHQSRALTLSQICEKMMNNNPNVDLVNIIRYTKYGQILSILSEDIKKKNLTSIKGHNSVINLQKMMPTNPNIDLININVYTKIGQILSILSQDNEKKRNSGINQGP